MEIKINGEIVTRSGFGEPSPEEAKRVCEAVKLKYQLGWGGVAAMFGMAPNRGGIMNIKNWFKDVDAKGRRPMPLGHYIVALQILGEFKIKVSEVK